MLVLGPEETVLLRLARKEPLADALRDCDAGALLRAASRQKVVSLLAERLLGDDIGGNWKRIGAAIALSAGKEGSRFERALANVVGLLASIGISPIVIKGPSLAMGRPRDCGDIDLLIPEPELTRAIVALESRGYEYAGFDRNRHIRESEYRNWEKLSRWSIQFEFLEPETKVLVELHTAFFETERMYTEDLRPLRSAIPDFISSSVEDPKSGYRFLRLEDRALLLALHVGLKRSPANMSFILRHVFDFDALNAAGLDWAVLLERSERLGVSHHLLLLALLYEEIAGVRLGRGIVAELRRRLDRDAARAIRLHVRCMKSLERYSTLNCFLYQFVSPFAFPSSFRARARAGLVLPLLVPAPAQLAALYGFSRRDPWLVLLYLLEPYRLTRMTLERILRPSRRAPLPG